MQSRCRGADTEMQMCRGAEVQRCRSSREDVQQRCIRSAAEVQRCGGAYMQIG